MLKTWPKDFRIFGQIYQSFLNEGLHRICLIVLIVLNFEERIFVLRLGFMRGMLDKRNKW